jgi:hypothetical protein
MEIIAGGMAVVLEAGIAENEDIVSTIPPSTFAGLGASLVPWLVSGGTLHLLHGFESGALAAQSARLSKASLVLPGPVAAPLHDAGLIDPAFAKVIALRRAPQRLAALTRWHGDATMTDVTCFGEIGLVAGRRGADGLPLPLPHGLINTPRNVTSGIPAIETRRTATGTLALRGPMVPAASFPPGAPSPTDAASFWDTGFACRDAEDHLTVTGPPPGTVAVGGYRFGLNDLETQVAAADANATVDAVPDFLLGERLAGQSDSRTNARERLQENGASTLIFDVFGRTTGLPPSDHP